MAEHSALVAWHDRQEVLLDTEDSFDRAYKATRRLIAVSTDQFRNSSLSTRELCFIADCTMERTSVFVDRMRSKSADGKTLYGRDMDELSLELAGRIRYMATLVRHKDSRKAIESAMTCYGVSKKGIHSQCVRITPAKAERFGVAGPE